MVTVWGSALCSLMGEGLFHSLPPMETAGCLVLDIAVNYRICDRRRQERKKKPWDMPAPVPAWKQKKSDNSVQSEIKSTEGRRGSSQTFCVWLWIIRKINQSFDFVYRCSSANDSLKWVVIYLWCVRLIATFSSGNRHRGCAANTATTQGFLVLYSHWVQPPGAHLLQS